MCLTLMAPAAPTLMCWMWPSFMMARGAPSSVLKSRMRPQNLPGATQYFLTCAPPGGRMSDFMRIASAPIFGSAEAMGSQVYQPSPPGRGTEWVARVAVARPDPYSR